MKISHYQILPNILFFYCWVCACVARGCFAHTCSFVCVPGGGVGHEGVGGSARMFLGLEKRKVFIFRSLGGAFPRLSICA